MTDLAVAAATLVVGVVVACTLRAGLRRRGLAPRARRAARAPEPPRFSRETIAARRDAAERLNRAIGCDLGRTTARRGRRPGVLAD